MRKQKVYDAKSKKWLTDEEYQHKYKKRQSCKGGREHDWVHVLPSGAEALPHYKHDPEVYYTYEKAIEDYTNKMWAELEEKHGIKSRYGRGWRSFRHDMRVFMCSVCHKQKYESNFVKE